MATSLAPRRVPEAFVRAEVWAYPLVSEAALKEGLVELDPKLESPPTQRMWRECEDHLTREASGWSLDRMIAVRDEAWFAPGRPHNESSPGPVPMHTYLRALAKRHLLSQPGETHAFERPEQAMHDVLAHYRWLSFALPEDLLLAALPSEPPPSSMAFTAILTRRRLIDAGVAEIHQHVGAGMDFPMLWAAALGALATVSDDTWPSDEEILESPGAWKDGKHLLEWLLVAAIARVVLAEYLASRDVEASGGGLWGFLKRRCGWLDRRTPGACSTQHIVLLRTLHALYPHWRGETPTLPELQSLYYELHPKAREIADFPPCSVRELWQECDPIAIRMGLSNPNGGERWLMRHGLSHLEALERRGEPDPLFAAVFWNTVRLRCQYFRYIVQRPLTAGLQWFIRFSNRIWRLRAPLAKVLPEAAFEVAGRDEPIAALEIRTTGRERSMDLASKLYGLLRSWSNVLARVGQAQAPEFGIVLHFAKQRDRARLWEKGRPLGFSERTCAQPWGIARQSPSGDGPCASLPRYWRYAVDQQHFVRALTELIQAQPVLLWLIRGIDVCDDELGVPTWVISSIFDEVRRAGRYASAARPVRPIYSQIRDLAPPRRARVAQRTCPAPPPLRITAHAGEDFRHPMAGLRRIFESVCYLMGSEPGRIGHATALGIDPRSWAESTEILTVPLEDRLWDLVFEWRLYTGSNVSPEFRARPPEGRMPWLEQRIIDFAETMFRDAAQAAKTPRVLARMYHLAHGLRLGQVTGDWNPNLCAEKDAALILDWYLHDSATFRRGQRLIEVGTDPSEMEALTQVQNALRRGIAARGVVIEVNPSSNLLIGDMLDLRHHPILRLRPIEPTADAPPAVPIAIGSDNPVTFCTSLVGEYALMEEAARAAGYSQPVVLDWLEGIRQTSMNARFTVKWLPSAMSMAEDLLRALESYLLLPSDSSIRR